MAVKLFLIKKKCYQSKVDGQSFNEDYGQICSAHVRQEFDLLDLQLSDYWYNLAKWFLPGIHLHWAENYYLINLFHKILYKWYLDVNIILYFYSSDIHRLRIIKLLEEIFPARIRSSVALFDRSVEQSWLWVRNSRSSKFFVLEGRWSLTARCRQNLKYRLFVIIVLVIAVCK